MAKEKRDIKAVFFDIDGTLVGINSRTVPVSTLQSIEQLKEKGILCFICTGRHVLDVKVLELPPFDGYITTNGACCELNGKVIFKQLIPPEDMERLIIRQKGELSFPCILENSEGAYLNFSNQWVEQLQKELHIRRPVICETFEEWEEKARSGIEQMLCFFGPESDEEILRDLLPGCAIKRWCSYFTDVIERSCDKAKGIDIILDQYHLSTHEIMAFGDGGNDISMLRHAGIGIAMGNAAAGVKAAADDVTEDVENDGIYLALKKWGII